MLPPWQSERGNDVTLYTFEVLRTRTITQDERAEVEIQVPDSVPEEEREEWALGQLVEEKLKLDDDSFTVEDESTEDDYQEVTEL